jgi:radical SAM protein with 4Fe4S-binding SPASM domain
VLLFSGGEPLLREDLFKLASFAAEQGIRLALSTNGTLITDKVAKEIGNIGFAEVGISLDGIGADNDRFRGKIGAYQAALKGIRNCIALGIRVSLRLTITRFNYQDIPAIFRLVEEEGIDRVCFYHLAYSGRGDSLQREDISHSQTRSVVDVICEHILDLYQRGLRKEILTVGNHADGVYLYLKLKKQDPQRAGKILSLLKINGGNNSGIRIGMDTSEPLMRRLKNRKGLLKGRCALCRYLDLCNGSLRVRAEAVYGDIWAEDPACYLNDEEIAQI